MGVAMTATICHATRDDLTALHALVERAYRGDSARQGWTHEADLLGGQRTDREELDTILSDPAQLVLVATRDDAMIGCVHIADKSEGLVYLGMLSVDPRHQASGLGKRLIDAAENEARNRFAARTIEMSVIRQRGELIDYYVRRGYAETGEERPFPLDDARFGLPRTRALTFTVMTKAL